MDVCFLIVKNKKVDILAQVKRRICFREREVTPQDQREEYS